MRWFSCRKSLFTNRYDANVGQVLTIEVNAEEQTARGEATQHGQHGLTSTAGLVTNTSDKTAQQTQHQDHHQNGQTAEDTDITNGNAEAVSSGEATPRAEQPDGNPYEVARIVTGFYKVDLNPRAKVTNPRVGDPVKVDASPASPITVGSVLGSPPQEQQDSYDAQAEVKALFSSIGTPGQSQLQRGSDFVDATVRMSPKSYYNRCDWY